ncbi:PspA/IM30 family protein [Nisaea sediminum]|uniref:PspA/IM30 family protein n=1 Tax=Nisaea sediminum TaxID=2775867 RepID=UPI0018691D52|nr:PspA/IM30 family protein [Nisaea sediminum]
MVRDNQQAVLAILRLTASESASKAFRELRRRIATGVARVMNDPVIEQTRSQVRVLGEVYQSLRDSGVPSQYAGPCVAVALKRLASGLGPPEESGFSIPLDAKGFALKSVDTVSVATVDGRVLCSFVHEGYENSNAVTVGRGELTEIDGIWFLRQITSIETKHLLQPRSNDMSENMMSRVSRLIAGLGSAVIDAAEQSAPIATLRENVRQLEKERENVRNDVGRLEAERVRIRRRVGQLEAEDMALDEKIRVAIEEGRDELAARGLGRQEDIVAQLDPLKLRQAELEAEIEEGKRALNALGATIRDLESEISAFEASERSAGGTDQGMRTNLSPAQRAERAADRAMSVSARITGVPKDNGANDTDLAELDDLVRKKRIQDKLAALKKDIAAGS